MDEDYRVPIPYPRGLLKWLMKLPLLMYRIGFGPLIGKYIMVLTTRGRRSGFPRMTAIEHRRFGEEHYIVSAWGSKADWYRNILKDPRVGVWAGRRKFSGVAEILNLDEKREALRKRWGDNEFKVIRSLFRLNFNPTEEQMNALLNRVKVLRIRPLKNMQAKAERF